MLLVSFLLSFWFVFWLLLLFSYGKLVDSLFYQDFVTHASKPLAGRALHRLLAVSTRG
jgi:hypothetical protein